MKILRENKFLNQLIHAGEMGERVALFDWHSSALGDSSRWPNELVSSLGIILENKFPMMLFWGDESIQFYNDRLIELIGDRHPESLGVSALDDWSFGWEFLAPLLKNVMKGESIRFDDRPMKYILNGKSVDRFFTFTLSPIRYFDGSIGGVMGTIIDKTSDMLNKNALLRNEEKFRTLLEAAPMPFISMDSHCTINYINPAALELISREIEEILGHNFWSAFPGLKGSVFESAYWEATREGKKIPVIGYFKEFESWFQVWAYPFNQGVALSFMDINESKRLEQKLNEAIIVRDDFLSISSHELNTPLTSLKIQSQLLQKDILSNNPKAFDHERIRKFSEHTEKQVFRLTRLIDDMLDVARIRSGKLTIKKEVINISQFLKDIILRMDPHFKIAGLAYPEVKMLDCERASAEWDPVRVEQVITNLINNAIRYGEGKPISVELLCNENKAQFCIRDEGSGIDEFSQERIFDRFERASEKQQTKGLGLGLYIAKQIVNAHEGKIWVESEEGKGSRFYVELPLRKKD